MKFPRYSAVVDVAACVLLRGELAIWDTSSRRNSTGEPGNPLAARNRAGTLVNPEKTKGTSNPWKDLQCYFGVRNLI